jgi:anti-sigma regulatory factor (Ser/Thr protein kinase)
MTRQASLTAKNRLFELDRLNDFLSRFCSENGLPAEIAMDAALALEEVFANIVQHGYRDSGEHEIQVRLAAGGDSIVLTLEDDGIPFNPAAYPPADTTSPLEFRPVGGLGVHLVRSVMDEVRYDRIDGRNRLVMTKHSNLKE